MLRQADGSSIMNSIKQSVQTYQADLTLEAAFNALEASKHVQTRFKQALSEFLNDPVQPTLAFLETLQRMKLQVKPPPTESTKGLKTNVDESMERKARMLKSIDGKVERKRKDIREKYRKHMLVCGSYAVDYNYLHVTICRDAKVHECKEAKIDVPADFIAGEDAALKSELDNLESALDEVKEIVESNVQSLHTVSSIDKMVN